jgi:hypothetical protein
VGVDRPSGLFIGCHFDGVDSVIYDGLDVFATQADELVTGLRERTTLTEEANGRSYTTPGPHLVLWRPTPEAPDDEDQAGRFFAGVLIARPGDRRAPD